MQRYGSQEAPRIAYLIKCFPRVSETFILHEVLELEHQGLPLRIFSLLEPSGGKVAQAVRDVQAAVTYVPQRSPRGVLALLAAAGRRFAKSPWRFLHTAVGAVTREPARSALRHLLYATYLAGELEREQVTHLHAHYANTPATVAQLVHQLTGIPFSFTAHAKDIYLTPQAALHHKMQMASFVVTCTAYNQRYLTALAGASLQQRVYRIYHGLNLRAFPVLGTYAYARPVRPLVLVVARLVEKKGLPDLLRACWLLCERGYDFDCRIVGEGVLRPNLERDIRELGLEDRVRLWGAEAHERVIEMYRQAAVVALPSVIGENGDRDGIPNVLVEALYMGVPVVSTPVSGIPELITSGVNGLLCPPHDPEALADAIARLLDDPLLRDQLIRAGRQTVLERFDMASNALRLKQLFLGDVPGVSFAMEQAQVIASSVDEMEDRVLAGTR
ncbi:MAG: glycosyltransferase family 4 protein [Chloroflexi bacterium]|nr:glycosyltransferase family 4 protein [Chloroflexota bacterium]